MRFAANLCRAAYIETQRHPPPLDVGFCFRIVWVLVLRGSWYFGATSGAVSDARENQACLRVW